MELIIFDTQTTNHKPQTNIGRLQVMIGVPDFQLHFLTMLICGWVFGQESTTAIAPRDLNREEWIRTNPDTAQHREDDWFDEHIVPYALKQWVQGLYRDDKPVNVNNSIVGFNGRRFHPFVDLSNILQFTGTYVYSV